ncbi:hypothetical protein D3C80_1017640 [compost metagenome]
MSLPFLVQDHSLMMFATTLIIIEDHTGKHIMFMECRWFGLLMRAYINCRKINVHLPLLVQVIQECNVIHRYGLAIMWHHGNT